MNIVAPTQAGLSVAVEAAPIAAAATSGAQPRFGLAVGEAPAIADAGMQALLAGLAGSPGDPDAAVVPAPAAGTDPSDPKHAAALSLMAMLFPADQVASDQDAPATLDPDLLALLAGTDLEGVLARALATEAAAPVAPAPLAPQAVPAAAVVPPPVAAPPLPGVAAHGASSGAPALPAQAPSQGAANAAPTPVALQAPRADVADPAAPVRPAIVTVDAAVPGLQQTATTTFATAALRAGDVAPTQAQTESSLVGLLGQRIQIQTQQGVQQATVRLEPYMAGTVQVEVRHEAGVLRIHLTASNDDVVRQLQTVGEGLRQELASRQFTDVSVQVGHQRHPGDGGHGRHARDDGAAPGQGTPGRALGDSDDAYAAFASVLRQMNGSGD